MSGAPVGGILLAFDFGTTKIGIAIGNTVSGLSSPLTTLANRDGVPDWDTIGNLIAQWQPSNLIVGLPLTMAGEEQEMSRLARRFAARLAGRYQLPVHQVDERLSSDEAKRQLAEAGEDSGDRYKVDSQAAQIILQSWLDQHHHQMDNHEQREH